MYKELKISYTQCSVDTSDIVYCMITKAVYIIPKLFLQSSRNEFFTKNLIIADEAHFNIGCFFPTNI